MADLKAAIRLVLVDQASRGLMKFKKGVGTTETASKGLTNSLTMTKVALAGLTAAIGLSIKEFAKLEKSIVDTTNLLGGAREMTNAYLRDIINLSKKVPQSTQDLSNALFDLVSATGDGENAMSALSVAADLATAGATSTKIAIDGLTSVINAYGLSLYEANRVSDIFFAAQVKGKLRVGDLARSIGNLAPMAKTAGLSLEEMFAGVATLTQAGINTERAVVGLRNTLKSLIAPSKETIEAFKLLNINIDATTIKNEGMVATFQKLMEATGGNAQVLKKILPDVRGFIAALSLGGERLDAYIKNLEFVEDQLGVTKKALGEVNDTLGTQSAILTNRVSSAWKSLMTTIAPFFTKRIKDINFMLGKMFDFDPAKGLLKVSKLSKHYLETARKMKEAQAIIDDPPTVGFGAVTRAKTLIEQETGFQKSRKKIILEARKEINDAVKKMDNEALKEALDTQRSFVTVDTLAQADTKVDSKKYNNLQDLIVARNEYIGILQKEFDLRNKAVELSKLEDSNLESKAKANEAQLIVIDGLNEADRETIRVQAMKAEGVSHFGEVSLETTKKVAADAVANSALLYENEKKSQSDIRAVKELTYIEEVKRWKELLKNEELLSDEKIKVEQDLQRALGRMRDTFMSTTLTAFEKHVRDMGEAGSLPEVLMGDPADAKKALQKMFDDFIKTYETNQGNIEDLKKLSTIITQLNPEDITALFGEIKTSAKKAADKIDLSGVGYTLVTKLFSGDFKGALDGIVQQMTGPGSALTKGLTDSFANTLGPIFNSTTSPITQGVASLFAGATGAVISAGLSAIITSLFGGSKTQTIAEYSEDAFDIMVKNTNKALAGIGKTKSLREKQFDLITELMDKRGAGGTLTAEEMKMLNVDSSSIKEAFKEISDRLELEGRKVVDKIESMTKEKLGEAGAVTQVNDFVQAIVENNKTLRAEAERLLNLSDEQSMDEARELQAKLRTRVDADMLREFAEAAGISTGAIEDIITGKVGGLNFATGGVAIDEVSKALQGTVNALLSAASLTQKESEESINAYLDFLSDQAEITEISNELEKENTENLKELTGGIAELGDYIDNVMSSNFIDETTRSELIIQLQALQDAMIALAENNIAVDLNINAMDDSQFAEFIKNTLEQAEELGTS